MLDQQGLHNTNLSDYSFMDGMLEKFEKMKKENDRMLSEMIQGIVDAENFLGVPHANLTPDASMIPTSPLQAHGSRRDTMPAHLWAQLEEFHKASQVQGAEIALATKRFTEVCALVEEKKLRDEAAGKKDNNDNDNENESVEKNGPDIEFEGVSKKNVKITEEDKTE